MVDHFSKIGRDTGIIILMILSGKKFSGRTRYHSSWKKTVQDNTIWFGKFFFPLWWQLGLKRKQHRRQGQLIVLGITHI